MLVTRSTFPQSFQGSLGVVHPLGALRLGAKLAHTPLKQVGEPIYVPHGMATYYPTMSPGLCLDLVSSDAPAGIPLMCQSVSCCSGTSTCQRTVAK